MKNESQMMQIKGRPAPEVVLEEASRWYEGRRSKNGNVNTNVMTVGIAVAELMKTVFPLTDDIVKSKNQSQVRGLSRALVSRVLKEHGVEQEFTSEGGRTSRGSLVLALDLAERVNGLFREAQPSKQELSTMACLLQRYFVARIQEDYFAKQKLRVDIDAAKPAQRVIEEILEGARARPDQPGGTVAQHLVGAKLEIRFPELEVGRDKTNAADMQTNRQGDFELGNTAFHVTLSPTVKLIPRVKSNIRDGYRPIVLVPYEKLEFTKELFNTEGLGERVEAQSIESFIGLNIEEMGQFSAEGIKMQVASLIRCYNERIFSCEVDKSLMIVEPSWISDLLGEPGPSFEYGVVSMP